MRSGCSSEAGRDAAVRPMSASRQPPVLIYNPACSKSRAAAGLLAARGLAFEQRDYLGQPLAPAELQALVRALGCPARELVRVEDAGSDALPGAAAGDEAWIALLAAQPRLLQRPILWHGGRAVVARPPERVFELF